MQAWGAHRRLTAPCEDAGSRAGKAADPVLKAHTHELGVPVDLAVTSSSKVANAIWVGQISGSQDLRDYDYNGTELAYAKFSADRQILRALDAAYGGTEFATPPSSLLYGSAKSATTQSGNGSGSTGTPTSGATAPPGAG